LRGGISKNTVARLK